MSGFTAVVAQAATRKRLVLLDTEDHFDAWDTGREAPEGFQDGQGLQVAFDGTGTIPSVTLNGPDGEIELRGLSEIRAVWKALKCGTRLAEAFGPPIPLAKWQADNA